MYFFIPSLILPILQAGGLKQESGFLQAGGLKDICRWLRSRQRPTPPETNSITHSTPEGCQISEAHFSGIPPGCGVIYPSVSGGVARQASLNHRLISGKPPAWLVSKSRLGRLAAAACVLALSFPLASVAQEDSDFAAASENAATGIPQPRAGLRTDPSSWILWRAAPIPFPDSVDPQVPELMAGPPVIDFGRYGADLTIIMPDEPGADYDGRALTRAKELIVNKGRNAKTITASQALKKIPATQILVLGTLQNNAFAAKLFGKQAPAFMDGINPGGYRIDTGDNPATPGKKIILALGNDPKGAWAAGIVLAHAFHPDKPDLNMLDNWPVKVPTGCYWLPFFARASPPSYDFEKTGPPNPAPPVPQVPFGPRIWGSPMPTLASYQRLMRALKPTGINTVVVQSGGWVDLPDAPEIFAKAVEIAWQEGIYTILYAGNEVRAHYPDPLTENHKKVVLATKDHPGLLAFHLYNQLAANLSDAEAADLKEQVKWIKSVTTKPLGMEIVWGHRMVPIPAEKIKLMRDLKAWGVDSIASDYAPIGGWADGYLPRWEQKFLELRRLTPKPEAVLQAHVPFKKSAVPTREQLRNQFWWALAGGARAFFIEVAHLHTQFTMRGMLSWDFRPLPDGRYDEMKRLAGFIPRLADLITNSTIATREQVEASGIFLKDSPKTTHLRLRTTKKGDYYVLIINEDTEKKALVELTTRDYNFAWSVTNVLTGTPLKELREGRTMSFEIAPGDAACLLLTNPKPNSTVKIPMKVF